MDKNGYYANLVKSQIGTEDNHKEIEKREALKKKLTKKLSSNYSQIIEQNELQKEKTIIEQKKIKVKFSEVFKLLSDNKCDLILGTIGGFIYGAGTPITGLFLGKVLLALSPQELYLLKKMK